MPVFRMNARQEATIQALDTATSETANQLYDDQIAIRGVDPSAPDENLTVFLTDLHQLVIRGLVQRVTVGGRIVYKSAPKL